MASLSVSVCILHRASTSENAAQKAVSRVQCGFYVFETRSFFRVAHCLCSEKFDPGKASFRLFCHTQSPSRGFLLLLEILFMGSCDHAETRKGTSAYRERLN